MPVIFSSSTTDLTNISDKSLTDEVRSAGLTGGAPLVSPVSAISMTASSVAKIDKTFVGETGRQPGSESKKSNKKKSRPKKGGKKPAAEQAKEQDPDDSGAFKEFRRTCDAILVQVRELESLVLPDRSLADGWEGAAIEIKSLLFSLRSVKWGRDGSLKRWVAAILFQVANSRWESPHVELLRDATKLLRVRYCVDGTAVDECVEIIKQCGLDRFRATVAAPVVQNRYKVVEV